MAPAEGPQHFRERAAEFERLSKLTGDPRARETLLYVALRWRAMADEDERRRHPANRKRHLGRPRVEARIMGYERLRIS